MSDVDLRALLDAFDGVLGDFKDLRPVNKAAAEAVKPFIDKRAGRVSDRVRRSGRTSGTKKAGVVRYGRKSLPWTAPSHFGHYRRPQGGYMVGRFYVYEGLGEGEDKALAVYEDFVADVLSRHF